MPLTYTDRLVRPTTSEVPTLIDIGVGLSRAARFAGQTRRWWSVLDHTLFGDELIQGYQTANLRTEHVMNDRVRWARLAWLLHDAHEALTSDVPTDSKPEALKEIQEVFDQRIYGLFFWSAPYPREVFRSFVKAIDARTLMAEAHVVGPPSTYKRITELFGGSSSGSADELLLAELLRDEPKIFGRPPAVERQDEEPQVREYIKRVLTLL